MRCQTCGQEIHTSYYIDWLGRCACASHGYPKRCECCQGIVPRDKLVEVSPGRYICKACINNRVTEKELPLVLRHVLTILYKVGFQDIQRDWVKFRIMSKPEIETISGGASGLHFENNLSQKSFRGRFDFDQSVIVLDNLNKVEFASVLGHELIHAWQCMNDLRDYFDYAINPNARIACEGFAQLGSFAVYNWFIKNAQGSPSAKLAEYLLDLKLQDADPAYGVAFKKILEHRNKVGWLQIIKLARQNKIRELVI